MSLTTFLCLTCQLAGNRTQSYYQQDGHDEDKCPRCGSDDIDVLTPYYDHSYDNN